MNRKVNPTQLRRKMIEEQLLRRGLTNSGVIHAMDTIPRHRFIPYVKPAAAYTDGPQPIGKGQTISQPYITAYMSDLLQVEKKHTVLEVGTGSGYQAAVLSFLCGKVYSIEIIPGHYVRARKLLEELGYENLFLRMGDGNEGWAEEAPFDRILVTAAATGEAPGSLLRQLAHRGRLVIPVGADLQNQKLRIYTRIGDTFAMEEDLAVRFVPLVGHSADMGYGPSPES